MKKVEPKNEKRTEKVKVCKCYEYGEPRTLSKNCRLITVKGKNLITEGNVSHKFFGCANCAEKHEVYQVMLDSASTSHMGDNHRIFQL